MGSMPVGWTCKTKSDHVGKCGRIQDMGTTEQRTSSNKNKQGKTFNKFVSSYRI